MTEVYAQDELATVRRTCPLATIPDVSFLGPDRVLDAAYALYVVDSAPPEEQQREIVRMARRIIEDFNQLYNGLAYGSPEWIFLFSLQQIMVSLAKGIGRRKRDLEERMRGAREKRDRRLREMSSNTFKMGLLRAGWRVLLWGGLGFFLTRSLLPKTAEAREIGMSPALASLAAAIATILIGSFIRARVTAANYNRIFDSRESESLRAQTVYNKGALEEYRRAKRDAARAWERYTHQKPTEWLAFDAVLAEDLAHAQDLCDEREEAREDFMTRWVRPIGHWLTKYMVGMRKRREERAKAREKAAEPPEN